MLYSGNITNSKVLDFSYACNISIRSMNKETEVEFDGDPAGFAPCTIQAAAGPLNLIVST